jgi:hypothetical protein
MYRRNEFEKTWKKEKGNEDLIKGKDIRLKKDAENLYWET